MSPRKNARRTGRPASSREERENQLVATAFDLAERQMLEDRASSQVITHFLKLGSTREKLEQERLQHENLLLSAKKDQLASVKRVEELYEDALVAMKTYKGQSPEEYDEYDEYIER